MKLLLVLGLLFLLTANSPAQSSFYPLHTGDTWVYWETPWNALWVDTTTYRVEHDSAVAGMTYKLISARSSHYGNRWIRLERVDSAGNVYGINTSTGLEELGYRLSDTTRSWWIGGGHLRRFDSTRVREFFGSQRKVLYVGEYTGADTGLTALHLLLEGIGRSAILPVGGIFDGGVPVLHHGWVGGVLFGTDPFAPPPVSFPLHTGDQWYYAGPPYPNGAEHFVRYVAGDTVMPNGKRYALIAAGSPLNTEFYRQSGDSVWTYDRSLNTEQLFLDFSRHAGDTVSSFPVGSADTTDITLQSAGSIPLFGAARRVWNFYVNRSRRGVDDEFALTVVDSLGVYRRSPSFGDPYTLQGAVIDGRVYGTINSVPPPGEGLPTTFTLFQNYPNPFNPSTIIGYSLPHRSHVTLTVYNTLGQKVAELVTGEIDAGYHEVQFSARNLASGLYFYRLQAEGYVATKRLLLVR